MMSVVLLLFCVLDAVLICEQIWQQMPNERGTTVHKLQKKFQGVFGFTLPLFHGRGLFNCLCCLFFPLFLLLLKLGAIDNWGLMPYRRRIVSVSE
jgi:2-acylglycerol O-acyltransferase 2